MTALASSKDHIDKIQQLAEEKWGSELNGYKKPQWQARLVSRYVELENEGKASKHLHTTINQRRLASPSSEGSQIMRVLETGKCTVDTLILLYRAVDCKLKVVQEKEV